MNTTPLPTNLELFRKYLKIDQEKKARGLKFLPVELGKTFNTRPSGYDGNKDVKVQQSSPQLDKSTENYSKTSPGNAGLYDPHNKEHVRLLTQAATYSG